MFFVFFKFVADDKSSEAELLKRMQWQQNWALIAAQVTPTVTVLQLIPAVKELFLNFLQLMYIRLFCVMLYSGDTR